MGELSTQKSKKPLVGFRLCLCKKPRNGANAHRSMVTFERLVRAKRAPLLAVEPDFVGLRTCERSSAMERLLCAHPRDYRARVSIRDTRGEGPKTPAMLEEEANCEHKQFICRFDVGGPF